MLCTYMPNHAILSQHIHPTYVQIAQPTPRKYSNQNSRSNTKIFKKRESRLYPDSFSISQQSQTTNPTRDGTKKYHVVS